MRQSLVLVGIGGLGCPTLLGVVNAWPHDRPLKITVIDPDTVQVSNLNRQILFCDQDIGRQKTDAASDGLRRLAKIPAQCEIESQPVQLTANNVATLLRNASIVVDGTDSTATKLLLNDFCVGHNIPLVYGGGTADTGLTLRIIPSLRQACLRCVFGTFSPDEINQLEAGCRVQGIVGSVVGTIGLLQAELALDYLLAPDISTDQHLLGFTLQNGRLSKSAVSPSPTCPLGCGKQRLKQLDLRKLKCPETFLYTKLSLEELPPGESLEVLFSSKESQYNVRTSCLEEGHQALAIREVESDAFRTVVTRGEQT